MKELESPLIAIVDKNDEIIGYNDKLKVHEEGTLHRAFSIFIFNNKGEMLIHQRAHHKYHSPSLWTNACCSHLHENMTMDECVHDRLQFEMGFDANVDFQFKFTYHEQFENGLTEHETDHVYFGTWEGIPSPNPNEVVNYKWISINDLKNDLNKNPQNYTYWFKHIMQNFETQFN
jgi:isopentenyl-diphosphate delta-isomerase